MTQLLSLLFLLSLTFSVYSAPESEPEQTLFGSALALQQQGKLDAAREKYQQLIKLNPALPEPRNNLAIIYMQQGQYDQAIDLLSATLNTHPAYATAWDNLKRLYQGLASEAYRKALSKENSPRSVIDKIQLTRLDKLYLPALPKHETQPVQTQIASATSPIVATQVPEPAVQARQQTQKPARPSANPAKPVKTPATITASQPKSAPQTAQPVPQKSVILTEAGAQAGAQPANPQAEASNIKTTPRQSPQQTAIDTIKSWATAWSSKDFDGYVAHYRLDYKGGKASRTDWLDYRRSRILRPGFIRVKVDRFKVKSITARRAIIDFRQRFESPRYQDRVRKRLTLTRGEDGWKISREKTLAVL